MKRMLLLICLLFPALLMGQYGHGTYGSGISGDSVNVGGSTDYVGISNNTTGMIVLNAATAGNYYGIKFTGSAWNDSSDKMIFFNTRNLWDASGRLKIGINGIGQTQTNGYGLILSNTTPATDVLNQQSPPIRFRGYAWSGASQSHDWMICTTPSQLIFLNSINGAAYTQRMALTSAGSLQASTFYASYVAPLGTNLDIYTTSANSVVQIAIAEVGGQDGEIRIGKRNGTAGQYSRFDSTGIFNGPSDKIKIDGTGITYNDGTYTHKVQYAMEGWVTHDNDTVTIGVLPANAIVTNVNLWTQEAFNSDGTDEVCCGFTGTAEAYAVDVDVSDTGVETWTVGSVAKTVDATSRTVVVYYHSSDATNLTTGECHVLVEWYQATVNP